ncbi:hypothetical protein [Paraburkholderia caledonica]|uniref:hypothetical protein n=1 Tax=Paraburkholderia caledonica TaxID=134536 RepID=UPI00117824CB|nr:hypothetical protein [Paraburkholderia caledonica]
MTASIEAMAVHRFMEAGKPAAAVWSSEPLKRLNVERLKKWSGPEVREENAGHARRSNFDLRQPATIRRSVASSVGRAGVGSAL